MPRGLLPNERTVSRGMAVLFRSLSIARVNL